LIDLHKFEYAITGFQVLFDGYVTAPFLPAIERETAVFANGISFDSVASMFAISRRRMVVPIYKKWDANKARVQIIKQEKVVQLVAFFDGFSHGKSMNFVLKGTDNFEAFSRSGKYGVRIVDAKFALPKSNEETGSEFVCLDMPEYPGEHDDITIGFDSERGKQRNPECVTVQ
jgi:hypothetical protein